MIIDNDFSLHFYTTKAGSIVAKVYDMLHVKK